MGKLSVAIQGVGGAFHEEAAHHYFHDTAVSIVPCDTFRTLVRKTASGEVDAAIMAVENSIAGCILPNLMLLMQFRLKIIGELSMRIRQNLIALPGQTIHDIRAVYSHPMALMQCGNFFAEHPHMQLVETLDTALSVQAIAKNRTRGVAGVAGEKAALLYGVPILVRNIQDEELCATRFLVVKREAPPLTEDFSKASIRFTPMKKNDGLAEILAAVADRGIVCTNIQSLPLPKEHRGYCFYMDMEFPRYSVFEKMIGQVTPLVRELDILGVYNTCATI